MTASSIAVDEALLALKLAFLVLLYLFIWRIVRSASRDVRSPQESVILRPGEAAGLAPAPRARARLVVVESPVLRPGEAIPLDSTSLTLGRSRANDVRLDGDEYVSARHARVEARLDGVWVEDLGSTNGTFVNGGRVTSARRLDDGDVVRVGQTDLRLET